MSVFSSIICGITCYVILPVLSPVVMPVISLELVQAVYLSFTFLEIELEFRDILLTPGDRFTKHS